MGCEIVLVDDDPEFSASMASMLEDEGYEVHVFSTPEAAFDWLLTGGSASLVLLDLRTPGMSAQRFRALLMSTPELRDLAVVVVSGDPHVHAIATSVGANDVFEKPVDTDRLLATVARHCQSYGYGHGRAVLHR
jgi:DNA-binding NtrC family response regulator